MTAWPRQCTARPLRSATPARSRLPPARRHLHLQPQLQRLAARHGHPLDAGQEPDLLGRSAVVPPRSEDVRQLGVHADGSAADRALPVREPGHPDAASPRSAQLLTRDFRCAHSHQWPIANHSQLPSRSANQGSRGRRPLHQCAGKESSRRSLKLFNYRSKMFLLYAFD